MSVKKDPSGQRSVEAQVEVPGTPEEVWQAIATGPGISAWFVPAKIEGRKGGRIELNFGPGMESVSKVLSWEPPHRLTAESPEGMGPGCPTVADEWTVEARAGGTCIVRVVHRWFADNDDWDHQFEGVEQGWPSFFRILRLYLAHFRGMPSAAFQLLGFSPESRDAAWATLTRSLGLEGAAVGQRVRTTASAPAIAGQVEGVGTAADPELMLRLDEPTPGVGHMFAMGMGGQTCVSMRCYLYGDRAASAVAAIEPQWQAWLNEHFPAPAGTGMSG